MAFGQHLKTQGRKFAGRVISLMEIIRSFYVSSASKDTLRILQVQCWAKSIIQGKGSWECSMGSVKRKLGRILHERS